MPNKKLVTMAACVALTACASEAPRVIQTPPDATQINLTAGIATQVEMPSSDTIQSVIIGNPKLATAEESGNVVNLVAKDGSGATNMIVRSTTSSGDTKVYQYRLSVQSP